MWRQKKINNMIYSVEDRPVHEYETLLITLSGFSQPMSERGYLFTMLRKHLSGRVSVIQFDYRGHGDSSGDLKNVSMTTMVEDTMMVMRDIVKGKFPNKIFFVGHGLGGNIGQLVIEACRIQLRLEPQLILISPLCLKLPSAYKIFDNSALQQLKHEGSIEINQLVPGQDYYTGSDFNPGQVEYFSQLGSHIQYLHGQYISLEMIMQLEQFDPLSLHHKFAEITHMIYGEHDLKWKQATLSIPFRSTSCLEGVSYYYQHPAVVDQLVQRIVNIIL